MEIRQDQAGTGDGPSGVHLVSMQVRLPQKTVGGTGTVNAQHPGHCRGGILLVPRWGHHRWLDVMPPSGPTEVGPSIHQTNREAERGKPNTEIQLGQL